MANLNKVMLIGRLTRDPEVRTFGSGGKVAAFGFAVNNKKKNPQTGQWEDDPVFLDIEAFNRQTGGRQLADLVEQYFKKGAQFYLEGHLRLDQWQDKNDGSKRSKLKIVLDEFQFFESRADGGGGMGVQTPRTSAPAQRRPEPSYSNGGGSFNEPEPPADNPDDIPF